MVVCVERRMEVGMGRELIVGRVCTQGRGLGFEEIYQRPHNQDCPCATWQSYVGIIIIFP